LLRCNISYANTCCYFARHFDFAATASAAAAANNRTLPNNCANFNALLNCKNICYANTSYFTSLSNFAANANTAAANSAATANSVAANTTRWNNHATANNTLLCRIKISYALALYLAILFRRRIIVRRTGKS
jgi:hypothetical protein